MMPDRYSDGANVAFAARLDDKLMHKPAGLDVEAAGNDRKTPAVSLQAHNNIVPTANNAVAAWPGGV